MRTIICGSLLLLLHASSHADLAADMRQLRSTISETAKTSKELGSLTGANDTSQGAATESALSGIKEGDVLIGKISSIKLFREPAKKAELIATINKNEEMIYTGNQVNGFYSVATNGKDDGWVEKVLVKKR